MDHRDPFGLHITLEDAAARAAWTETIHGFLRHGAETPDRLGCVLERAPQFAMGWAAKGLFTLLLGRPELTAPAAAAHDRARAALGEAGGTARERAYADALGAWLGGRPSAAAAILTEVLDRHPEDALAMKLEHAIRFVLGDRRGMLAATSRLLPAYGDCHPFGGYATGCHAFALEENGRYAEAERAGLAAIGRAPDDAWGLHAVAHVYDMTARDAEGVALLETQSARWTHCNNFAFHVWWHLALFHLDRGEYDRVLALYDAGVRAEKTDDYRDIANAASLLTRLEIEGVGVGDRWEELADLAEARVEPGCLVFADLHYLLALGGAGREAAADRLVARLAADAAMADHEMHEIAAVAGHPAAEGLAAYRRGDCDTAWAQLSEVRPHLQRVGGSHAQRDVFSRIAIEAAIRAGRLDAAEAELSARAARRGAEDGFTARRRAAISEARRASVAAE